MALSRRDFFRKIAKPREKSREERIARYEELEQYVQTELLPYDFALTAAQQDELFTTVRKALEETADEELFSAIIRFTLDETVDRKIRPWREANRLNERLKADRPPGT